MTRKQYPRFSSLVYVCQAIFPTLELSVATPSVSVTRLNQTVNLAEYECSVKLLSGTRYN